ncbi:related to ribitol kinase [Ceraceosorus bombacis]|uniref:Related to ribitol kinase n=1 Tax=Ceraceosorus bombacis TaxID=401625 RepID=A0A0N7LAT8_9BASI|nr:related to ribitol kinase [Ceraceosorus bombacis]
MSQGPFYIGVDVGTGSARAALLDADGNILSESTHATRTWRSDADARIFEQSTDDIWARISQAVRDVLKILPAGTSSKDVKGIGFDATCSLAVINANGEPIEVTPEPEGNWKVGGAEGERRNIILWADHRAEEEAKKINSTGSMVLNYVGGTMSLEMEVPKMLWLSTRMPKQTFASAHFYDLPDYLTYRATGSRARSNCSLVCKCSYVPPGVGGSSTGWQHDFFNKIGLSSIADEDFERVGGIPGKGGLVLTAGQPLGSGLTKQAAQDLGLEEGTAVGSALIDAYAGWVGTVAAQAVNATTSEQEQDTGLAQSQHRLAAIAGTSTCHVVQSPQGIDVKGVWGPYKNAVFPGMWMNEGGQSSTGQLIDFIIDTHPAISTLKERATTNKSNLFTELHGILDTLQEKADLSHPSYLIRDLVLYPDLHGNRSPLADSGMRGLVSGLALDRGVSDLAKKYYATLEAIALQTRHILAELNGKGHSITSLYMSGGHVKNAAFMQLLADVCQVPVLLPNSASASVVAGSAILGRFAAELREKGVLIETQEQADKAASDYRERLWELMTTMTKPGTFVYPRADDKINALFDAKYKIFHEAIDVQRRWRKIVADAID